jgi:hypothetical protein
MQAKINFPKTVLLGKNLNYELLDKETKQINMNFLNLLPGERFGIDKKFIHYYNAEKNKSKEEKWVDPNYLASIIIIIAAANQKVTNINFDDMEKTRRYDMEENPNIHLYAERDFDTNKILFFISSPNLIKSESDEVFIPDIANEFNALSDVFNDQEAKKSILGDTLAPIKKIQSKNLESLFKPKIKAPLKPFPEKF